jgi:hypothetical protein
MGRPKKEVVGVPTRLWADTIRILRTLSAWRGVSMAEYVDELAREAVARHGGDVADGLKALISPAPAVNKKK